uniref:Nucleoside phosphorylase domain-containing protein n=1 Tax=Thermosporothrix sp. COM3 TaxID=2490863 RepID=A0A455SMT7_9CHLR|nr:hypothetical protein KTC_11350 [Thermosporothrix sp. COM3]
MLTYNHCAVLLTTNPIEHEALRSFLGETQEETYKGTIYEYGFFRTSSQIWKVGLAQIGKGNTSAAMEAERAITCFQPSVVMLVSFAQGFQDVKIGDVVVASKIYGYEFGQAGLTFAPRPELNRPSHPLLQRAMAVARKPEWRHRIQVDSEEGTPQAHIGPLAAGEKTITSLKSEAAQRLKAHYGDALAVEMEGYGFLHTLYANVEVDALVICGIMDLIHRQSKMQRSEALVRAAHYASAFAFEVLATFQPLQPLKRKTGSPHTTNVLAVFANPPGTDRLRLDREERAIRAAIERSKFRDHIHLETRAAATLEDLSRALLDETYQIIHIAGHGNGRGLVLADEDGGMRLINQAVLADLLQEYRSTIQCVLLNSCYSFKQGSLLSQYIPYTIATDATLHDNAAIKFAEGFYDAISAGQDIAFAYREGRRRLLAIAPNTRILPQLIPLGETFPENSQEQRPTETHEPVRYTHANVLVGFALDVSSSMQHSFLNQTAEAPSRLNDIRRALSGFVRNARKTLQEVPVDEQATIDMFIYGFGLKTLNPCDLLSLWKASKQVLTDEVVQDLVSKYKKEQEQKYKGYRQIGALLQDLAPGSLSEKVRAVGRSMLELQIRKRIWREKREAIEQQVHILGDTTLSLDELATWWNESGDLLSNAESLLFGRTSPLAETLTCIAERFERELRNRPKDTQAILFIISDGKTQSDPLPLARKLREMGVLVCSCFLTDQDVQNPRQLLHEAPAEWSKEAQLMFHLASPLPENTRLEDLLIHHNWTIHPQPQLFVQINHSEVLREFHRIILDQFLDNTEISLPDGIA